jgi:hypothetical protein
LEALTEHAAAVGERSADAAIFAAGPRKGAILS